MYSHLQALIRKFLNQSGGAVLPTFVIALIPIMASVGAAVDFSRVNSVRTNLQTALDAAVLAGARDGTATATIAAMEMFKANVQPKDATVADPSFTRTDSGKVTGSVSAVLQTT